MKTKQLNWILGLGGNEAASISCVLAFIGFVGTYLSWYVELNLLYLVLIPPLVAGSVLGPIWGVFVGTIGSCGFLVFSDFYIPIWLSTLLGLISGLLSRVLRDQWASALTGWLGPLLIPQPWYISLPYEIIIPVPRLYTIWAIYPIAALISFIAVSIISISPVGIWLTKSGARLEYGVIFSVPTTRNLPFTQKRSKQKPTIN